MRKSFSFVRRVVPTVTSVVTGGVSLAIDFDVCARDQSLPSICSRVDED
jgi:hypothetical protein